MRITLHLLVCLFLCSGDGVTDTENEKEMEELGGEISLDPWNYQRRFYIREL